jgi:glycosyltransferase involved in cell wall biosynthesis
MRARVLFLSQCLPFPPHSGVTNRTYHILRELEKQFDVALVAFSRRNHQADAEARRLATAALADELTLVADPTPIAAETSLAAKLWNHARSTVARRPYTFYEYGSADFSRRLAATLQQFQPDLVHLDSLDLYRWMDQCPPVPVTCTHHSIESDLLRLRAEHIRRPLVARYLRYQADLLERIERTYCDRFALNVLMSDADAERLRALAPNGRTLVVPNGVDTQYFAPRPTPPVPGRIVFVGPTYMFPNRDAVDFFLEGVWPIILRERPDSTLHLIGRAPPEDHARFSRHEAVTCQGYVPDIRPHLAEAACSVVPIRVGGGTRLKILDAWAMGKAIVSTSIGCEGLATRDQENILVRDDPRRFAEAVLAVLGDERLRARLGTEGRRTAEATYAWETIGRRLTGAYRTLLGARPTPTAELA